MTHKPIPAALPVILLLCLAALVVGAGCLKESAVTVSSIIVGAQNVTGADVTLNVTSEVHNTYGVSSGVSRVYLPDHRSPQERFLPPGQHGL